MTSAPLKYQFLDRPVDGEDLETILNAARAACKNFVTEIWTTHYIQSPLTECVSVLHGAPAVIVFTSTTPFSKQEWLEFGMFLQSLKLAARPLGITVVPISKFEDCEGSLRELNLIPAATMLLCGAAVGYLDPSCASDPTDNPGLAITIQFFS